MNAELVDFPRLKVVRTVRGQTSPSPTSMDNSIDNLHDLAYSQMTEFELLGAAATLPDRESLHALDPSNVEAAISRSDDPTLHINREAILDNSERIMGAYEEHERALITRDGVVIELSRKAVAGLAIAEAGFLLSTDFVSYPQREIATVATLAAGLILVEAVKSYFKRYRHSRVVGRLIGLQHEYLDGAHGRA